MNLATRFSVEQSKPYSPSFSWFRVNRRDFKPGEKATRGAFWVHHYAHRVAHVVLIEGGTFPKCNECGDRVSFEPALNSQAEPVWEDRDFGRKAS